MSPITDEPGFEEAKEFARKNLIGKEVNVFLKNDSGLNITASIVRISDSKDVETMMLENGWAHLREEYRGKALALKLQQIEYKSKQNRKGLFKKEIGNVRNEDLTIGKYGDSNYQQRCNTLLRGINNIEEAIIQGYCDSITYKVKIQSKRTIIKLRLEGIKKLKLPSIIEEVKAIKEYDTNFYKRNLHQRNIYVNVSYYDDAHQCFVGTIRFNANANRSSLKGNVNSPGLSYVRGSLTGSGIQSGSGIMGKQEMQGSRISTSSILPQKLVSTLQQRLVLEGLVYADKEEINDWLMELQERARQRGELIWGENIGKLQPKNQLKQQKQYFLGRISWIEDGHRIYIQPIDKQQLLQRIGQSIAKTKKQLDRKHIVVGSLCMAPYEGDYYRARIESIKNKTIEVYFIDWGNRCFVKEDQLLQLDKSLLYIPQLCFEAHFHMVKAIYTNQECLQCIRDELINGDIYTFHRVIGKEVQVFRGDCLATIMGEKINQKGQKQCKEIVLKVITSQQDMDQKNHKSEKDVIKQKENEVMEVKRDETKNKMKNIAFSLIQRSLVRPDLTYVNKELYHELNQLRERLRAQRQLIWQYPEQQESDEEEQQYLQSNRHQLIEYSFL